MFWKQLGDPSEIKSAEEGGDDIAFEKELEENSFLYTYFFLFSFSFFLFIFQIDHFLDLMVKLVKEIWLQKEKKSINHYFFLLNVQFLSFLLKYIFGLEEIQMKSQDQKQKILLWLTFILFYFILFYFILFIYLI